MTWRDFWNRDNAIYVNDRHKVLHYETVAADLAALVTDPAAPVLDHGCGEALSAHRLAAACSHLYLCDGAPTVRDRLRARFGGDGRISVLAPEEVEGLANDSLGLVVANSLLQYLSREDLEALLDLWRRKLRPDGRLVLADVIPPGVSPVRDAAALLAFAARGGFLGAALLGLVRTAASDYSRLRGTIGLTRYTPDEMASLLRRHGFRAERLPRNVGHNPARMTFSARPEPVPVR